MKLAPHRIAAFLRKPDPAARLILVYGPDGGLVRERSRALVGGVVDDPSDPFRVALLSGAALAGDPARLADEAAQFAFTGGRRVVHVSDAGDEIQAIVAHFLDHPLGDALIVVEAGDLSPRSSLRKLCEAAANAAAMPCYLDAGAELEDFIVRTLGQDKIRVGGEALAFLAASLGGDRAISRSELAKLAVYVGPGGTVTVADAVACVGDGALLSLDDVAERVAAGDAAGLMRALDRAYGQGVAPVALLRAVARHFQRLHLVQALIAEGSPADRALAQLRPPLFFKRRDNFVAQLRRWPLDRLGRALERLVEAEIGVKRTAAPIESLAARALVQLAQAARAG